MFIVISSISGPRAWFSGMLMPVLHLRVNIPLEICNFFFDGICCTVDLTEALFNKQLVTSRLLGVLSVSSDGFHLVLFVD